MAIQKKQIEEEEEDPDFEDEEEMFEEDEQELKKPLKKMEVERTNKFSPKPKTIQENRFVAFHSPAVDGIMDKTTNKLINQGDLWEIQAEMLSILHRIEESLG